MGALQGCERMLRGSHADRLADYVTRRRLPPVRHGLGGRCGPRLLDRGRIADRRLGRLSRVLRSLREHPAYQKSHSRFVAGLGRNG